MKTNAPPRASTSAAREKIRATIASNIPAACSQPIASDLNPAQDQNQPIEIAHVGAIWKSPRDKRQCIQAQLRAFNGSPFCDLRIFELDHQGRMRATSKGLTISPQRLMQLAKLVGDAARKATALGLIEVSS
jgi:hypothetical protein